VQAHITGTAGIRPAGGVDGTVFHDPQTGLAKHSSDFCDVIVFYLSVGPWKAVYQVQKTVPGIPGLEIVARYQHDVFV